MPGKVFGKGKKPAAAAAGNKKTRGGGAGQKWCPVHKTTSHNDKECYAQGTQRAQTTSSTHTAAILSVDSGERSTAINFDDDFDKGF